jgi:heat-inducible transcriptional repressor
LSESAAARTAPTTVCRSAQRKSLFAFSIEERISMTEYMELSERSREILRSVILAYIESHEPVGSRTVSKQFDLGLSPATIRNAMADLEESGFLFQPHTSAGRLPTEVGLRYYVDCLLEREGLSWGDQVAIEEGFRGMAEDLESTLRKAVRLLADYSGHVAVVSAPRLTGTCLRHIEFVRIRPTVVLVIMVSDTAIVQNRLAKTEIDLSEQRLEAISRYINSKLLHMSLEEAKSSIMKELEAEKRVFDVLLKDLLDRRIEAEERGEIFIGGRLNLLDQPEFSSAGRLRGLLKALEDKTALITLLDRCMESGAVQIFIGSEGLGYDVPDCGMVLAPYAGSDYPLGSLGVVGPMRMNYARVISLVEYTAQILSERLKES